MILSWHNNVEVQLETFDLDFSHRRGWSMAR